jgi:peptidyl-prolyl cis-trans isomerase SurA
MKILSSILCVFVATLSMSMPVFAAREKVEGIVAIVNSEIVTESEVRAFSKKVENEAIIDDLLLLGANPQSLKGNRKAQLDYLINEKLLESEIKRLNLSVTVERVEQELRDVAKKNNISRAELNNAIKAQGMNFSDYQDFVKGRIERQSLIEQEITSKIRVSDEEVLAEYTKIHPDSDSGIFEYTVAHILFNPRKGGVAGAEERARAVLKKLKDGQVFEALAEQHSEDTGFANGGLLGTFKAGEFSREMETAVARLNPGETTDIVKSKAGLHILKLISKKVVSDPRFEREKEKIRNQLFEKAFTKQLRNWIEQKKEDSFIRINEA